MLIVNKKYITEIQNKVLELLPKEKYQEKALLLKDCCSELSRLVASWINENDSTARQVILKGENVRNTNRSHDVLVSIDNGNFYLIDPTIWQFFPNQGSILVGIYVSLNEAIAGAEKKYGGSWQISENLKEYSPKDKAEWLRIVKSNIREVL